MSKLLCSAALIGLVSLGVAPAYSATVDLLYIDDANGNIGTVDLATKAVNLIGNAGVVLTDIGFTSNGSLYGTSFNALYSVSKTTGSANLIGSYGAAGRNGMNALVGDGDHLLAASNATTGLYSIGVSPFSISTLAGSTGGGSAGDLAFASSGNSLYGTQSNGDLVKINIAGNSFTSSIVGNTGVDNLYGLATARNGVTYAIGGTEIYTVNLGTASLTPYFDYAGSGLGNANGTAFISEGISPVPLPPSVFLFGVGLVALGALGFGLKRKVAA